jgi:hypothetical protein
MVRRTPSLPVTVLIQLHLQHEQILDGKIVQAGLLCLLLVRSRLIVIINIY